MTVTRIFQAGAELQHINEIESHSLSTYGSLAGTPAVSNTKAKTGAYSFAFSGTDRPIGKAFSSTTQVRANYYLNHAGVTGAASSNNAVIFLITGTFDILIQWASDTATIELLVNGTIQASLAAASSAMTATNTWYALGINVKANASTGWVSFYVDGVQKLTWTGNTGSSITGVYGGGRNSSSTWNGTEYIDDLCIDDTVGEADAAPPSPRFSFLLPNGAGNYTNWTANTGSNYAAVDDSGAPNDETDYVYATSSGLKDSYALTNTTAGVTVPSGYQIDAVIPIAWARKTDAGTASTLKVGTRLSSTDNIGSAQTLTTSFGPVWERQTTDPSGGAWSEADIDSAEIVIESAGSY